MTIFRYASIGVDLGILQRTVPGVVGIASNGPETFIDIDAALGSKDDLDEVMKSFGWVFVATDPLVTAKQAFEDEELGTIITPPSILLNQNDYNPAGFQNCDIVCQDVAAAALLTGLAAPVAGTGGGRRILFCNTSSVALNVLTLVHESLASATPNRFLLPAGANIALGNFNNVELWYDTSVSRWRAIGIL